jgi:hypothetical protein
MAPIPITHTPYLARLIIRTILHTLQAVGFSLTGPVTSTIASWVQSILYGGETPAGSLFSLLQRLAMTGGAVEGVEMISLVLTVGLVLAGILLVTWPIVSCALPLEAYLDWLKSLERGEGQESLSEVIERVGHGWCKKWLL